MIININAILDVTNDHLNNIDMSRLETVHPCFGSEYISSPSGREHYRLLVYISSLFSNKLIFDVGTHACKSAIALSSNPLNRVKSYDVVQLEPINPKIDNVEYFIGNAIADPELCKSSVIFLDVCHDGIYEDILYNYLCSADWKGLLLLDDINLNGPMKSFWNKIKERKYDITRLGHWSGTGVVVFE